VIVIAILLLLLFLLICIFLNSLFRGMVSGLQRSKSHNLENFRKHANHGIYSFSRYWTGTSLQLRLSRGVFSNAGHIYPFF